MCQTPAQQVGVSPVDGVESASDSLLESVFLLCLFLFGFPAGLLGEIEWLFFQDFRRKHRYQCDGRRCGDAHHYGNNPAELFHKDTHHAGEHGKWHKHSHKHQGGGDDGGPHLVGGADGCLARVFAAFDVLGDVLQHHNGVVHHHTYGHGERGQRDDIQRTVGKQQVDERCYKGDGYGERDDDGGAPVAEEYQHHEYHEQQGVEDGFGQAVDGVDNLFGAVAYVGDGDVGGEGFLNLLHFGTHLAGYLHGVGAGLFGDDESCAVLAVDFLVEGEVLDGVAHGGEVADENLFPCGSGGNGDVGNFRAFHIFALNAHLVLLFAHFDGA